MPPASVMGDQVIQPGPHCHTPHPIGPVPAPVPHPPLPLNIVTACAMTVLIGNTPAATATSQTVPCTLPGCAPGGPGIIMMGSPTVMINNLPAARMGDQTNHPACVAPIPAPMGQIIGPGVPTVIIN
jgi:uncharacterized Zn-binding protein involved in type VI secretion